MACAPYTICGPWIQDAYGSQSRYTRVTRYHTRLIGAMLCVSYTRTPIGAVLTLSTGDCMPHSILFVIACHMQIIWKSHFSIRLWFFDPVLHSLIGDMHAFDTGLHRYRSASTRLDYTYYRVDYIHTRLYWHSYVMIINY
jgi:hypothetical protein